MCVTLSGARLMHWSILLVAIGIACSMVHAMLLNDFLHKNAPEECARDPGVPWQRPRRVYLVREATPRWVILLGLPALPLLLLGSVLIAIACLVSQCHPEAALGGMNL
jgi:hypothetical protein